MLWFDNAGDLYAISITTTGLIESYTPPPAGSPVPVTLPPGVRYTPVSNPPDTKGKRVRHRALLYAFAAWCEENKYAIYHWPGGSIEKMPTVIDDYLLFLDHEKTLEEGGEIEEDDQ